MITSMLFNNRTFGVEHPKIGIMIHSTGANNPYLKRYVPNDPKGLIGENKYNNTWDSPTVNKSVTGFVGKLESGDVEFVLTLPPGNLCWHSGKKSTNEQYCAIEICEDSLYDPVYFWATIVKLVEGIVYIAKYLKLDLSKPNSLISHAEGFDLGMASNHGDPHIWWDKYKFTMDELRKLVETKMNEDSTKWYDEWMKRAERYELMTNERPEDNVTRGELAVVAVRLYEMMRDMQ